MKPSSLSTCATFFLRFVAGMSTAGRSIRFAFRMRVSMSAKGSVIIVVLPSPARLLHAGNQPVAGHVAETNATDAELAIDRPSAATELAAAADANPFPRRHLDLVRGFSAGLQLGHLPA